MATAKKAAAPAKGAAKKAAKPEKAPVVHNEDGPVYVTFANGQKVTYPNPREARAALRNGGLSVRDGFTKAAGNRWTQNKGGAALAEKPKKERKPKATAERASKSAKAKALNAKANTAKWKLVATGTHQGIDYTVSQQGGTFKGAYIMAGQTFGAGEYTSKEDAIASIKKAIEES